MESAPSNFQSLPELNIDDLRRIEILENTNITKYLKGEFKKKYLKCYVDDGVETIADYFNKIIWKNKLKFMCLDKIIENLITCEEHGVKVDIKITCNDNNSREELYIMSPLFYKQRGIFKIFINFDGKFAQLCPSGYQTHIVDVDSKEVCREVTYLCDVIPFCIAPNMGLSQDGLISSFWKQLSDKEELEFCDRYREIFFLYQKLEETAQKLRTNKVEPKMDINNINNNSQNQGSSIFSNNASDGIANKTTKNWKTLAPISSGWQNY